MNNPRKYGIILKNKKGFFNMAKNTKPIFTDDELDAQKTGMAIGYENGELIMGNELNEKPKNKFAKGITAVTERIDGTARKRRNHMEINKFGYATFYTGTNEIWFGVKYSSPKGVNTLGKSTLEKYNQLLEYYLRDSGWDNITRDKFSGDFIVKLNNPINLENLRKLSTSIGFYYKGPRPDAEDIKRAESAIRYLNRKQRIKNKAAERDER